MSLLEKQYILARLLTDPGFREQFLSEPDSKGREAGLNGSEIREMLTVAARDLDHFTESLVWKRRREVEKLLPITSRLAGDNFQSEFLEFARTFNPRAIKKHYEDAVRFSKFVEARHNSEPVRDAARFERTRLMFFNNNWTFAYCRSHYDLEKIQMTSKSGRELPRRERTAIALWLRVSKRVFHFKI